MNIGCLIGDAYGPANGSNDLASGYSANMARKEEKRKAKRCKGPPAAFFDIKDPDRQHLNALPEVPPMNPKTGIPEHTPVYAPYGSMEPFENQSENGAVTKQERKNLKWDEKVIGQQIFSLLPRTDDDPKGDKARNSPPQILKKNGIIQPTSTSYFGKDPDEGFANFQPDTPNYLLEPGNFPTALTQGLTPESRMGSPDLPVPSVMDVWKPAIASNPFKFPGANTSYIERLPYPGGSYPGYPSSGRGGKEPFEMLTKKMDRIIARLDDMQRVSQSPEQSQTEIMMFIGSGVFVLFLLDLLMKKGVKLF